MNIGNLCIIRNGKSRMSENKTKETDLSVKDFLNSLKDEKQQADAQKLVNFIQEISDFPPKMWGSSIIGFGFYNYKYESWLYR